MDLTSSEAFLQSTRSEDSRLYTLFKKLFVLWLVAMAGITIYGGLQLGWWVGIAVTMAWQAAILFIDAYFNAPAKRMA